MARETGKKDSRCCSIEHERLVAELETCDQLYQKPSEWHRCARVIARRSGQRAKKCMLQG
jgi:hypothetical protein